MIARKTLSESSALALALLALGIGACRSSASTKAGESAPAGSVAVENQTASLAPGSEDSSASASAPSGVPISQERIDAVLNPRKLEAYDGPVGVVEGTVRIEGPEAPKVDVAIPSGCGDALASYSKLFREGTGRTLGDALVTVTEYEGYVPRKREAKEVPIRGCAFDTRTIAVTFGERLEINNRDTRISYLPQLLGSRHPVDIVAVPKGDPVRLYPTDVGHYVLGDGMARKWMHADVFVLKYPTHDVTGLDGKFRIEGVPVGKVRLTAYLPAIDTSVDREVEVKPDGVTEVELTLKYESKKGGDKKK